MNPEVEIVVDQRKIFYIDIDGMPIEKLSETLEILKEEILQRKGIKGVKYELCKILKLYAFEPFDRQTMVEIENDVSEYLKSKCFYQYNFNILHKDTYFAIFIAIKETTNSPLETVLLEYTDIFK